MDSNLNQKQMASFQSAFSQARQNIMNNPNVFAKESKRINKLAGIFEKEYGVELPRIRALNEVEKFYSPTRLKQLSDQGLDIKAASNALFTVKIWDSANSTTTSKKEVARLNLHAGGTAQTIEYDFHGAILAQGLYVEFSTGSGSVTVNFA